MRLSKNINFLLGACDEATDPYNLLPNGPMYRIRKRLGLMSLIRNTTKGYYSDVAETCRRICYYK